MTDKKQDKNPAPKEPDKTPITISGRTWFSEQYVRFLEAEIDALTQKVCPAWDGKTCKGNQWIRELEQKVKDLEADLKEANFYRKELGERVDELEAELKKKVKE